MAIQKITNIIDIMTDENDWWMIYDDESKEVFAGLLQLKTRTNCIVDTLIMIIADSKEELLTYITDNGLTISDDIKYRGY
jgi:hypothetical protein